MFRPLANLRGPEIQFTVDGRMVTARSGDSVAAALFRSGIAACRTSIVSGHPRGPYCMMGICFDCLVVIDGKGSQQACLTPVSQGMAVEIQIGRRSLSK